MSTPLSETVVHDDGPPVRLDADGALRAGASRVLLDLIVRAYTGGVTPETIARCYPSVSLADVYAVIAYYLRHRGDVEAYLGRREGEALAVRRRVEHSRQARARTTGRPE